MAPPLFKVHDAVTLKDGDGVIGHVLSSGNEIHAGERWYKVRFGASHDNCRESDLRLHADAAPLNEMLSTDEYGGPDAFRRHATAVKLNQQLTDTLYSYGASRTQLFPYQFVPLLKFLASPYRRILIADEVGLGKTIEAGYILQEELARGRLARVLVICPASLRLKWHDELRNRFGHRFELLDAAAARHRVLAKNDEHRAAGPLRAIVSLQSIRNERFIETVTSGDCAINLLIVDEAHHCRNTTTLQAKAVAALVEQADSAIFLTATPIQTSERNLFSLLHMLVPEEFPSEAAFSQRLVLNQPIVEAETLLRQQGADRIAEARHRLEQLCTIPDGIAVTSSPLYTDLLLELKSSQPDSAARRIELQERLSQINLLSNIFTRTKRRDVHLSAAQRKAIVPEATLTPYEQTVYDSVSDVIFEEYQGRHGDRGARLVLSTYQRQLASSLPAALRKFRQDMAAMDGEWDDEIESGDEEIDRRDQKTSFRLIEHSPFRHIVATIDIEALERDDTKYRLLLEALRNQSRLVDTGERLSKKTLVFSYFRRSLDYLEQRLRADGFRFVRIDGGVKTTPATPATDERHRRISQFRQDADIDIMLTSEVGSEGLDFQFCDALINWDLPWNPMVVEQRIGRLDRIGQKSPQILIVNLACKGTIEEKILGRLYDRIGIFERSIGELEPILGDLVRELELELFRPRLTPEQQERVLHSREIALANIRSKQQALEDKAALLIGHDEFFRAKLDRIKRFGRYVGGDELRLFADNELRTIAPGLTFERCEAPGVYRLPYRPEVQAAIESALSRGDEEGLRFLSTYRRGAAQVAFEGDVAERHFGVEPVHAQHPLIRTLSSRLGDDLVTTPQVACMCVESEAVAPGPWFYLWCLIKETGFLAARSIMCCVLDLRSEGLSAVEPELGDQLLADMLRGGRSWSDFNPPTRADADACLGAAERELISRVDELRQKRSARMDAIKGARRATVEATFQMRIERQRARLNDMEYRATYEDGARRILPAVRARLEQLEQERIVQIDLIDQLKLGTVRHALLGAGFVNVVSRDVR